MDVQNGSNLSGATAEIVSAYVSNNGVRADALAALISDVHAALKQLSTGKAETAPEPQEPAVPIRKSVTPDYIISLENGLKFKSLKRHLMNAYGLTPDTYRAKWGLPRDYPMVAPNYSKSRSELAKSMGLGRKASVDTEQVARAHTSAAPDAPQRSRRAKAAAA